MGDDTWPGWTREQLNANLEAAQDAYLQFVKIVLTDAGVLSPTAPPAGNAQVPGEGGQ